MDSNHSLLQELWVKVNNLNKEHFPNNNLAPIVGNGETNSPKIMFVFINPTKANISSSREWQGPRFPFIGTKQVWRIFHRAGLFDDNLMEEINDSKLWSLDLTAKVLNFLKSESIYITNIVKWTGQDATLPDSKKISLFLPILEEEIRMIKPKYIVAFGLIPFENLTSQKIKLGDYHSQAIREKRLISFEKDFGGFKTKVIPCYFPVGRGNPKKAVEILKLIKELK